MKESKDFLTLWYNRYLNADSKHFRPERKCHTWYCPICKAKYYSAKLVTLVELPDNCSTCGTLMKYFPIPTTARGTVEKSTV